MKVLFILAAAVAVTYGQSCGTTPHAPDESRIVGGKDALPYSWPWQIELCVKSIFTGSCSLLCGGSVIDEYHILSAAHCVKGQNVGKFAVRLGLYQRSVTKDSILIDVESAKYHPMYQSPNQFSHDWSILKLKTKITFSDKIQPVCLPSADKNVTAMDRNAIVTGWGTTRSGGSLPDKLQQVRVPFVGNAECSKAYPGEIDETMVCAGNYANGGVDSCQGDSGGPMVVKSTSGKWYEYGVVSWGQGCAEAHYPGVYSRVTQGCDFFKDQVGKDVCVDGNF